MSSCDSQLQKKKGLAKVAKERTVGNGVSKINDDLEPENEEKVLIEPDTPTIPSVLLTFPIPLPFTLRNTDGITSGLIPQEGRRISLSSPTQRSSSPSEPVNTPCDLSNRYIRKDSLKDKSSPTSAENDRHISSEEICQSSLKDSKKEESEVSPKKSFFQAFNRKSFIKKKSDTEKLVDDRSKSPSPSHCQLDVPKLTGRSRSLSRLSDVIDNVHHVCLTPTKTTGYLEANVSQQNCASSPTTLMVASPSSVSSTNINPNPDPNTNVECSPSSVLSSRQSRTHFRNRITKFERFNSIPKECVNSPYSRTSSASRVDTIVEHQELKSFNGSGCEQNGKIPSYVSYIKNKHVIKGRRNKRKGVNNKHIDVLDSLSNSSVSPDTSGYGSKMNTDSANSSPPSVATSMSACEQGITKQNGMVLRSTRVAKNRTGRPTSWNTLDHSSFEEDGSSDDVESHSQESEASDEPASRRWSSLGHLSINESAPLFQVKLSEAKQKNYLFGGLGSLLGTNELSRYFPDRNVVIFIATWNMNGKEPPYSLDDFLLPDDMEHMPDMFVIGTQESGGDRTEWEVRLQTSIGPSHVLFHSAVLGILHLTVFIRRDLVWFCSVPEEGYCSLRPGTYFKTKGAIAISFQFFGTRMLFVNTHLFAHEEKLQQRLQNYKQIIHNLDLPRNLKLKGMTKPKDVTNRYDVVFWMGDLNFRLVGPRDDILERIKDAKTLQSNVEDILCFDQLNQARNRGEIFQGFGEGKINFAPTFKFDVGTNHYDSSSKQRVPSYTDRILFKSTRDPVKCTSYGSCPQFKTSDHKPVWGVFHFKVRPGKDDIPLAAGLFQREVYLTALKRRRRFFHQPSTKNCNMQ